MKKALLFALMIVAYAEVDAQLTFKTEVFGKSDYRMKEGDSSWVVGRGAAVVYQGGVTIPLSVKMNENNRPSRWTVSVGGAYVKLDNSGFKEPLVVDEIMNVGVGLSHLRPLNERWSVLAMVGGGIYMPNTQFSRIGFKNVLGSAGLVFIRHLKPNLVVGGGLSINNSFGYPMIFPAVYLNWETGGKYAVKVEVIKGLEVSVKYKVNNNVGMSLVAEMNGQLALLEQDGKDKIFSHQYLVLGLRPEIKVGKYITIPVTLGMSAMRPAKMMDRKLKSLFKDDEGYNFKAALYGSAGVQVRF